MVTTVPPTRPLAYTRRPIFVSASVHYSVTWNVTESQITMVNLQAKTTLKVACSFACRDAVTNGSSHLHEMASDVQNAAIIT
jgi:hypothetical protein